MKSIRWEKPRVGWLTLNINGSATSNSGPTGGGGLVRDENGDWVKGFARRIGNTSSYLAELDAKAIVEAFNSPTFPSSCVSPTMDECRHMATQIP